MVQTKVTQKALLCDSRANKRRVVAIGQQPHGNDQRGGIDSPVVLMGLENRLDILGTWDADIPLLEESACPPLLDQKPSYWSWSMESSVDRKFR